MTDDKLHRDIVRGGKAHELINSELLQEAFARLERDYIAAWRETPARDTDARERLWQAVNIVGKVKEHLGIVARDGRMAQRQLDELIKAQEQAKKQQR
jgi:hypothetical protein